MTDFSLDNKDRRAIAQLRGEGYTFTSKAIGDMAGHREFGIYASAYVVAAYYVRHRIAGAKNLDHVIDLELTHTLSRKFDIGFGKIEPVYSPDVRSAWNSVLAQHIQDILRFRRDAYAGAHKAVAAAVREAGPLHLNTQKYKEHVIARLDYARSFAVIEMAQARGVELNAFRWSSEIHAVVNCQMPLDELLQLAQSAAA